MCNINALVNGKKFEQGRVYNVHQVQSAGSVCEVSNVPGFIVAKYKGGTVLVFDRDWKFLAGGRDYCELEGGGILVSDTEIEVDGYNIYRGEQMMLIGPEGVIHQSIRGFMPLSVKYHLVRFDDGGWRYCNADGSLKCKGQLRKMNVTVGNKAVMFDERGKMRLGQVNAHYSSTLCF